MKWSDIGDGAPKAKSGFNYLEIAKIRYERNGEPYKSKIKTDKKGNTSGGDPQIMVVFKDRDGGECIGWYTISKIALFGLQNLISACGIDTKSLDEKGYGPLEFYRPEVADDVLIGRRLWAWVEWEMYEGKERSKVTPKKPDEVPPAERDRVTSEVSDTLPVAADIPF